MYSRFNEIEASSEIRFIRFIISQTMTKIGPYGIRSMRTDALKYVYTRARQMYILHNKHTFSLSFPLAHCHILYSRHILNTNTPKQYVIRE